MRLLWIAVVLALFQCNHGQEDESATVNIDLINSIFIKDQTNQDGVTEPNAASDHNGVTDPNDMSVKRRSGGGATPDGSTGADISVPQLDPTENTKKPNVS